MPAIRLSRAAENDLRDIAIYTLDNWGEEQSILYVDNIESCFQKLAANPLLGRSCATSDAASAAGNTAATSHKRNQLHISRILHERMLPLPMTFPTA